MCGTKSSAPLQRRAPRAMDPRKLEEAKSNARYSLTAALDNTDEIAGTLARFVRYRRSYDTVNNFFRVYDSLTAADVETAARKYFTDDSLVVTTLSQDPLAGRHRTVATLASFASAAQAARLRAVHRAKNGAAAAHDQTVVRCRLGLRPGGQGGPGPVDRLDDRRSRLQVAADRRDQQGVLSDRRVVQGAGRQGIDVPHDVDSPRQLAGIRGGRAAAAAGAGLPPGRFRPTAHEPAQCADTRPAFEQRGRAGQGVAAEPASLQARRTGTRCSARSTGLGAITLDDVKAFAKQHYTTGNLQVGINGGITEPVVASLATELGKLPAGTTPRVTGIVGQGATRSRCRHHRQGHAGDGDLVSAIPST